MAAHTQANGNEPMTLQQLFGIELPIIQAPMAGSQGSALALAVSNAGGLGSLPCATLSLEAMRDELAAITAQTDRPVNVNFFCHGTPTPNAEREMAWRAVLAPYYHQLGIAIDSVQPSSGLVPFNAEIVELLAQFQPAVVSFHFGLPSAELLQRVRAWGAKILSSATTVAEAQWLAAQGVDAVIAQGLEAGGHRGMFLSEEIDTQVGTFALLPQIVRAVKIPVIAAGGIADAQGVAAAIALGAAGVQVGTTYLLCPEATTSTVHRAALRSKTARHTALTNIFTGRPARAIANQIVMDLGPMSDVAPMFPMASAAMAPLRAKAESQGSGDFSPLWAGQNASGCQDISAANLTRALAAKL